MQRRLGGFYLLHLQAILALLPHLITMAMGAAPHTLVRLKSSHCYVFDEIKWHHNILLNAKTARGIPNTERRTHPIRNFNSNVLCSDPSICEQ